MTNTLRPGTSCRASRCLPARPCKVRGRAERESGQHHRGEQGHARDHPLQVGSERPGRAAGVPPGTAASAPARRAGDHEVPFSDRTSVPQQDHETEGTCGRVVRDTQPRAGPGYEKRRIRRKPASASPGEPGPDVALPRRREKESSDPGRAARPSSAIIRPFHPSGSRCGCGTGHPPHGVGSGDVVLRSMAGRG